MKRENGRQVRRSKGPKLGRSERPAVGTSESAKVGEGPRPGAEGPRRGAERRAPLEGWHGWDEYAAFYDWENRQTMGRRDGRCWSWAAAPGASRFPSRKRPLT